MLTKDFDFSLDLGKLTGTETSLEDVVKVCTQGGGRKPPMLPSDFVEALKAKSFTNGKEDRPMVGELYRIVYSVREADGGGHYAAVYSGLGWGDEEMVLVALGGCQRCDGKTREPLAQRQPDR
eukprot:3673619-Prymnesium_polylepis.2